MVVAHQYRGSPGDMKVTSSDLGGSSSDSGATRSSSSPVSPDMNSSNLAVATAAAAALSAGLHHGAPEGVAPLLSHSQIFRNAPTAESLLAASQRAAIMAATAAGGNPLRLPVSLHTTLASGPPLFHHQHGGSIFNWSSASVSPPPVASTDSSNNNRMAAKTTVAKRNNNNHLVSSSSAAVTRKNQANARKRGGRNMDPAESTIIEVAAMTQITAASPSPPTSGAYKHGVSLVT